MANEGHGSVAQVGIEGADRREIGETLVHAGAVVMLPSSVYRQFHDVTLPTEGGTTQIDHVFVSVFGVFVMETKTCPAFILGSDHVSGLTSWRMHHKMIQKDSQLHHRRRRP
ncbi:MAG: nuclease-related domain-containing protein [Caldilineaceae bacterium]|nr:nuclease-related domain-containing protein [Caldilineaceae bacterium]